jgi:ribosome maturation factor RimP
MREQVKNRIEENVLEEIVDDVVTTSGYSLVDMKLGGRPDRSILKVYIYRPEGVGVDDCAAVSRELGAVLDERNVFPSRYILEVSSPGAERVIQSKEEYEVFKGREVRVDFSAGEEETQTLIGVIAGLRGDGLVLELAHGEELTVPLDRIRKAKLYADWKKLAKRNPDEF